VILGRPLAFGLAWAGADLLGYLKLCLSSRLGHMSNHGVTVLMCVLFVGIVLFDVYLLVDGKKGNTYSERMRHFGNIWKPFRLIVSFGFCLLLGHWYW